MIYISTGGFSKQPSWQTCELLSNFGIHAFELSGGSYDKNQLNILKSLTSNFNFQVHNYFPPPELPFVFNLASLNQEVAKMSMRHAEKSMQWSVELNRPVYSFHAGFMLDVQVSDLGKVIKDRSLFDITESKNWFLERVNSLSDRARELGVDLLIENNVLSQRNSLEYETPPFLMLTSSDCIEIMHQTPDNVNMLVDVAHLKVSAKSLGFSPIDFLKQCDPWIVAYHLSDNDGKEDSNSKVEANSWFWPYLKTDLDYYSLEIYNISPQDLLQQHSFTSKQIFRHESD